MKAKWVVILVLALGAIGLGWYGLAKYRSRAVVSVQTGRVVRQDIARVVVASGEIKPRNYINIGANAQGQLVDILVKEGDRVRKGQLLARIEDIQPQADLEAQRAAVGTAEADSSAFEAGIKAADQTLLAQQATIERTQSDLEKAQQDHDRYQNLLEAGLVARQDFEARRAALKSAAATVREAQSRLAQSRAQRDQAAAQLSASQKRAAQARASMARYSNIVRKHNAFAPLDGVVTNLPVRVGETVVPGIQNSAASTIMTIADLSLITAEVKVDEADIVSLKLDQATDISIDAVPNQTFHGRVIEIGNTAILRSSGLAASQSAVSGQEAKDFKVIVALDNPPDYIRPGLSCTARVTTATRQKTLTIPVQALTVREKGDLEAAAPGGGATPARIDPVAEKRRRERVQGVFAIQAGKAKFLKVESGISGSTEIEVLGGIQEDEEIITGPYQVIRTLRPGAQVKVDNQPPQKG